MSTPLDLALDAAADLQAHKQAKHTPSVERSKHRAGLGPDRPMPYIAALPARELFIDCTYQRQVDPLWVRQLVEDWDPTMLGVLDVSDRGADAAPRYAVINGQHRRAVAIQADPRGDDVPLVCNVHRGLTIADEALLFHELDARQKRLTSWDRWHARRGAGDRVVLQIEEVVGGFGMTCSAGQNDGRVGAVGALETLHVLGGQVLVARTMAALFDAFGRAWAAYQSPLVTGVGLLLRYYEGLDTGRLAEALGRSTPQQLRAQAAALRDLVPGALARCVAQVLVNRMNSGRGPRLSDVREGIPAGRLRPTSAGR